MLDSHFAPSFKLYDTIRDLKEIRKRFDRDASGFPDCLSTFTRDSLQHQISILEGVAANINSLSNLMVKAHEGYLVIMDGGDENVGYHRKVVVDLTSKDFRESSGS